MLCKPVEVKWSNHFLINIEGGEGFAIFHFHFLFLFLISIVFQQLRCVGLTPIPALHLVLSR